MLRVHVCLYAMYVRMQCNGVFSMYVGIYCRCVNVVDVCACYMFSSRCMYACYCVYVCHVCALCLYVCVYVCNLCMYVMLCVYACYVVFVALNFCVCEML